MSRVHGLSITLSVRLVGPWVPCVALIRSVKDKAEEEGKRCLPSGRYTRQKAVKATPIDSV